MENVPSAEDIAGSGNRDEKEKYIPRLRHRLALLALIYLSVRYLDSIPGPGLQFDVLLGAAVVYTAVMRLASIRISLLPWLVLIIDLALVIAMCGYTGGISSLVKYFGIAYLYLMTPYVATSVMKAYLLCYSVIVTLLVMPEYALRHEIQIAEAARLAVLNLFVLNGAGWPSVMLSGYITRIRDLQRDTALTFHSLNSALHLRTQNLQAALDALTQAHAQLKKVDENKTRFLSNVSHELRTPLSSVRSFTEILMNYDDVDRSTQKEFLGIIHDEAARLNLLVNDILDVVRLDSGKVELHMAGVDMAEVIRDSVKTLMPMAADKGLFIRFTEPEGWTPSVKGDANQLKQVMLNLINNAVKFTAKGGITISLSKDMEELAVSVSDTGEGVYPEERERIFDEFFRVADNVSGRPAGSGLGLPISRKIIELHGGSIWVESELGKGSDFRFAIPLDLGEFIPQTAPDMPVREKEKRAREKPTVLVAEENSSIRQLFRKKLEAAGYETLGAESGVSALKLATEWEPDCIVSGMQHFKGTDINLYSGLRTHPKTSNTTVILTYLTNDQEHGLQLCASGFVQRPIDHYGLTRVMEACVKSARGPVMVISEDRLEARAVQLMLGNKGYAVVLSEVSAWKAAMSKGPPSAVILDGSLPAQTICDIATAVSADHNRSGIPVIIVTDAPVGEGRVVPAVLYNRSRISGQETLAPLMEAVRAATG